MIVYQVLRQRVAYRELGADYYDRLQPVRLTRHLVRRLEQLGHKVTLEDRAAPEPQAQPVYFSEQYRQARVDRDIAKLPGHVRELILSGLASTP